VKPVGVLFLEGFSCSSFSLPRANFDAEAYLFNKKGDIYDTSLENQPCPTP
jgi:hypothetical protein